MKAVHSLVTLVTAISSLSDALRLAKKSSPAVIGATTHRRQVDPLFHDHRRLHTASISRRQDDTVTSSLENEITLYFINVTVGTPGVPFQLHIDTGSSDLWVNTPNSQFCQRYAQYCDESGVYTSSDSSTYKLVSANGFNVTYADGSAATGDYVSDTLAISGTTLQNFEFGVATVSNSPEGILGVGYTSNEGASQPGGATIYPNLPQALADAGAINSNAYSLYLDDLDASTGMLLFGGVDRSKFSGELTTFPIIPTYGYYSEFLIGLTGIGQNGNAGSLLSNQAIAVLLDSGTSLMYLPDAVVNSLYSAYGTTYNANAGAAIVPCSLASQSGSVDFTFSSLTISVPLSELVVDLQSGPSGSTCAFGIAPAGNSGIAILGDTFLRSAYVVYDLQNNEISMAQATYTNSASDVVEIQSGTSGVPDSTPVASAVTAVDSSVVTGAVGNVETIVVGGSGSGSGTGDSNAATSAFSIPNAMMVGAVVAMGFVGGLAVML